MAELRSLTIGLTGGIGTGKSRVAELLRKLGAAVECSDQIVHELQAPGGAVLGRIAAVLGAEFVLSDGQLDRAALGALVFRDPEARRKLGEIIHPEVYRELKSRLDRHRSAGEPIVVLDIPLLLEGRRAGRGSGAELPFDRIVMVYADPASQLERIMSRDGLSRDAAQARIDAQMPVGEKRAMADVVIENTGEWADTERQVREQYELWLSGLAQSAPPR